MTPTLIDTDPGVDDALALLAAWGTPALAVETITTVAGNVPVRTGTLNVFRLLALRRPSAVPIVAEGAAAPLTRSLRTATHYHGDDGLGDLADWPPAELRLAPDGAVAVMLEAARRHGARLTLVALGPLTNVALAVAADAPAMRGIGRVVVMGGAVDVPGNVTAEAEFNIHVDPDAAARTLGAGLELDLVPLDATRQVVLDRSLLEAALRAAPAAYAERILRFTERSFGVDRAHGTRGMVLHDPLAVGLAADASLATWETARLEVGADGQTRRGHGAPNVRIARTIDARRFLRDFSSALCRVSS
jgi:inosine-uridine nucleoside N-ribohydrolase